MTTDMAVDHEVGEREMIDLHRGVTLIQALVRIPSESSGQTLTDGAAPEQALAAYLARVCGDCGIDHELQEVSPGRPNFIARFPSTPGAPRLLIVGHLDTVSAAGMDTPFAAEIRDERIWGRGACDDKGPLATALGTLLQLHEQGRELRYEVILAATIDEECSLAGAAALKGLIGSWDLCLCLEPTGLTMVKAHKRVYRCRITARGKAVHSSAPDLGDNAILTMMEIIKDLQLFEFRLTRHKNPELGKATLAVTQIRGGASINTIPDQCEIAVDVRLLPEHHPPMVGDAIRQLIGPRGTVEDLFSARGVQTRMDNPLIREFQERLAAHGLAKEGVTAAYATDCSELHDHGPCIIWGPGHIAEAHQVTEHIAIDQVRTACAVLSEFLLPD
jgi:acetylornithine deacetylase